MTVPKFFATELAVPIPNLSIKAKLIAAFTLLCAFIIVIAAVSLWGIGDLSRESEMLGHNTVPSVRYAGELRGNVIDVRVSVVNHVLYAEPSRMASEEQALAGKTKAVQRVMEIYASLVSLPGEREMFETFKREWTAYLAGVDGVLSLSRGG